MVSTVWAAERLMGRDGKALAFPARYFLARPVSDRRASHERWSVICTGSGPAGLAYGLVSTRCPGPCEEGRGRESSREERERERLFMPMQI